MMVLNAIAGPPSDPFPVTLIVLFTMWMGRHGGRARNVRREVDLQRRRHGEVEGVERAADGKSERRRGIVRQRGWLLAVVEISVLQVYRAEQRRQHNPGAYGVKMVGNEMEENWSQSRTGFTSSGPTSKSIAHLSVGAWPTWKIASIAKARLGGVKPIPIEAQICWSVTPGKAERSGERLAGDIDGEIRLFRVDAEPPGNVDGLAAESYLHQYPVSRPSEETR